MTGIKETGFIESFISGFYNNPANFSSRLTSKAKTSHLRKCQNKSSSIYDHRAIYRDRIDNRLDIASHFCHYCPDGSIHYNLPFN
ncbi:MAG: hypothetical protein HOD92_15360 [Deltaproteobacteria bacterium]|nr:hypothetical protein [Deltaproteobacteria bacterium]